MLALVLFLERQITAFTIRKISPVAITTIDMLTEEEGENVRSYRSCRVSAVFFFLSFLPFSHRWILKVNRAIRGLLWELWQVWAFCSVSFERGNGSPGRANTSWIYRSVSIDRWMDSGRGVVFRRLVNSSSISSVFSALFFFSSSAASVSGGSSSSAYVVVFSFSFSFQ